MGGATTWHDYIVADGRIVAEKYSGATNAARYFVLDHLGSIAVVANESGDVLERDSYDAWGKRRNSDGSDVASCSLTSQTTHGFTNQEEIDALCLVNLNARIYDPGIGRFLTPDDVVPDVYRPQSLNPYTYVENRPLTATDPTGHSSSGTDVDTESVCPNGPGNCKIPSLNEGSSIFSADSGRLGAMRGAAEQNANQGNDQNDGTGDKCPNHQTSCGARPDGMSPQQSKKQAGDDQQERRQALRSALEVSSLGITSGMPRRDANSNSATNGTRGGDGTQMAQEIIGPLIDTLGARAPLFPPEVVEQLKVPVEGLSGKDGATDIPSWARGMVPKAGQSGKDAAGKAMDKQYEGQNWKSMPRRMMEFRKLQKYFDRHFKDPEPPKSVPTNII